MTTANQNRKPRVENMRGDGKEGGEIYGHVGYSGEGSGLKSLSYVVHYRLRRSGCQWVKCQENVKRKKGRWNAVCPVLAGNYASLALTPLRVYGPLAPFGGSFRPSGFV